MGKALLACLLFAPITAYASGEGCTQDSFVRLAQGRCIPLVSKGPLNQPLSIALGPAGLMFIASRDNGLVLAVTKQGVVKSSWTTDGAPISLAVDLESGVLYCATTKNRIMKFNFQGQPLGTLADITGARGLAFTSRGTLFVAVADAHVVLEVTKEGKTIRTIGRKGKAPGEFQFPQRIAVDRNDNLWVAELDGGRIQRIDKSGRAEVIVKDIRYPSALDVTKSAVWFASSGRAIAKFNLSNKQSTAVSALDNVNDFKVAQSGEIYVLLGHPIPK